MFRSISARVRTTPPADLVLARAARRPNDCPGPRGRADLIEAKHAGPRAKAVRHSILLTPFGKLLPGLPAAA
jgi:hypothetical protein